MAPSNPTSHRSASLDVLLNLPDMSANVADILGALGAGFTVGASTLRPLQHGQRACGPALTLRYRMLGTASESEAGAGLGDKPLYAAARPGDIAVIECPHPDAAVLGSVSARWAQLAGLSAVVIDGAARDTGSISSSGLAVWSATRTPHAALGQFTADTIGEPVRLAGNLIESGDIVVADDDGIAVIPRSLLHEVAQQCIRAQSREDQMLALIDRCASVAELSQALAGDSTHP